MFEGVLPHLYELRAGRHLLGCVLILLAVFTLFLLMRVTYAMRGGPRNNNIAGSTSAGRVYFHYVGSSAGLLLPKQYYQLVE